MCYYRSHFKPLCLCLTAQGIRNVMTFGWDQRVCFVWTYGVNNWSWQQGRTLHWNVVCAAIFFARQLIAVAFIYCPSQNLAVSQAAVTLPVNCRFYSWSGTMHSSMSVPLSELTNHSLEVEAYGRKGLCAAANFRNVKMDVMHEWLLLLRSYKSI